MDKNYTDVRTIFSLDVHSLALFRILLGIAIILEAVNRIKFIPAFYSESGIVPLEMVSLENITHAYHFQLMMISGSEWFALLFFLVLLVFGVMLILGLYTKAANFFAWLLFCSAIVRDPLTSHAGDTLLIVLLFWGLFLPLGKVFSVDSLRNTLNKPKKYLVYSPASIAMYVQFSLVYITTGLFKANYDTWLNGTHLYITLSRFDYVEPLAFLIYPYYELLTFLTHITLYLELFGPLLLFIPIYFFGFRMLAIFLFVGLQVSIGLLMDVGIFPLISIAGILVLLPSGFWNRITPFVEKYYSQIKLPLYKLVKNNFPDKKPLVQFTKRWRNAMNGFLVASMIYVSLWNIGEVSKSFDWPDYFKKPGYYLKLNQKWSMFAAPANKSEYYALEVIYEDDSVKDLMERIRSDKSTSDSEFHHEFYSNYRWRIFFSNRIGRGSFSDFWETFVNYKLESNNISIQDNTNIKSIELVGYWHQIGNNYNHSNLNRSLLLRL